MVVLESVVAVGRAVGCEFSVALFVGFGGGYEVLAVQHFEDGEGWLVLVEER